MPNFESVRRIIGRGIIQNYITEDDGGMMKSGTFTGGTSDVNLGFKPKFLYAGFKNSTGETNVYLSTEDAIIHQYDFEIRDYSGNYEMITAQNLRTSGRHITFTAEGFVCSMPTGTGYYFAIG